MGFHLPPLLLTSDDLERSNEVNELYYFKKFFVTLFSETAIARNTRLSGKLGKPFLQVLCPWGWSSDIVGHVTNANMFFKNQAIAP